MPIHRIVGVESYDEEPITSELFGLNLVLSNDVEFAENQSLQQLIGELGISTMRYPGGSVTETLFAEANFVTGDWNASNHIAHDGTRTALMTLQQFIEAASNIGANVQLVIPTRVAFSESAGQALHSGSYGQRTDLAAGYLDKVKEYVELAISLSRQHGVEVSRLEIGNEFWGSGQMDAREYGQLAATLTQFLGENFPGIEILAQVASSANVFSPREDSPAYLEPIGNGDFRVHVAEDFPGAPPEHWERTYIPAAGNAVTQVRTIADQFLARPMAVQFLTGIVDHVYFKAGFAGIDGERDFALNSIYPNFVRRLGTGDLDHFLTEWGVRNPHDTDDGENLGNANGLQYAHSIAEAFFELTANGVDGASFWPATFGNPNTLRRVLVDTVEQDLTFGGYSLRWLSDGTQGLRPLFDYDVSGEIDVHGYGNSDELTFFVSNRSGVSWLREDQNAVELDFSDFSISSEYFTQYSRLTSDDGSFDDVSANPLVQAFGGLMTMGETVVIDLHAHDFAKVNLQRVTPLSDTVIGGENGDFIRGRGGNDTLIGYAGDDTISGDAGNDLIYGGDGGDTLNGSTGSDLLVSGQGENRLNGGAGPDTIVSGGQGDFLLGGEGADTFVFLDSSQGASVGDFEIAEDKIDFNLFGTQSLFQFTDAREAEVNSPASDFVRVRAFPNEDNFSFRQTDTGTAVTYVHRENYMMDREFEVFLVGVEAQFLSVDNFIL